MLPTDGAAQREARALREVGVDPSAAAGVDAGQADAYRYIGGAYLAGHLRVALVVKVSSAAYRRGLQNEPNMHPRALVDLVGLPDQVAGTAPDAVLAVCWG